MADLRLDPGWLLVYKHYVKFHLIDFLLSNPPFFPGTNLTCLVRILLLLGHRFHLLVFIYNFCFTIQKLQIKFSFLWCHCQCWVLLVSWPHEYFGNIPECLFLEWYWSYLAFKCFVEFPYETISVWFPVKPSVAGAL